MQRADWVFVGFHMTGPDTVARVHLRIGISPLRLVTLPLSPTLWASTALR
jgi:hypothetical protein